MSGADTDELEYLRFFYGEADFGPADEDVRRTIEDRYKQTTGNYLPKGYGRENMNRNIYGVTDICRGMSINITPDIPKMKLAPGDYITPDVPKMKLAPGDYITPEFRKEIDEWLVSFFGVTNIVPDGKTMILENPGIVWMNPRTFKQLHDKL